MNTIVQRDTISDDSSYLEISEMHCSATHPYSKEHIWKRLNKARHDKDRVHEKLFSDSRARS